ncbi:MAG TPA: tRNA 2-thiouridine(34) synthase MnmA [Hyphomicrobiaceae bacterium]|nr:tRNA 2-thiouridine(34) synthase MnmA [Hyphomicrobiaceae bacterium]
MAHWVQFPGGTSAAGPGRRRIVVALSGGVDSSVAAALLVRAGHEVIGITLQLYDHGQARGRKGACCAGEDIHDARRVAERLAIPHYVLDYERRFARAVIDGFADSYLAGETPIPCVACNREVKFRDLLDVALDLGAELMATGHYVERRDGPSGPALYRPADAARDQSYFLFATTRSQLERLAFPLGRMKKADVRALAREFRLPVADKGDSQDICFVPNGRYASVIERLRPGAVEPGDIVHIDGRVLGRHQGIVHYTVGQRRGLKLAHGEPLYVVGLDAARRRVIVGPREALLVDRLFLREVNWLGDAPLAEAAAAGLPLYVRVRSSQPPQPATLHIEGATLSVQLAAGEPGVAAGQACVFYADDSDTARVLGGGFIAATARSCERTAHVPPAAHNACATASATPA